MDVVTKHKTELFDVSVYWTPENGIGTLEMSQGLDFVLKRAILTPYMLQNLHESAEQVMENTQGHSEALRNSCKKILEKQWSGPFLMNDDELKLYYLTNPF